MIDLQAKRKVLMISDHPLSVSGVGTQARYLSYGLVGTGKYTFRCLGAAIKHENYEIACPDPDIVIRPIDGFGNKEMLRVILASEKPDALLIFNDPRFFSWLFEIEDEVHQICPIVYNHLWDNGPVPEFNRVIYESTDAVNCINYDTYQFVNNWYPDKTRYVPHALPAELFRPLPPSIRSMARNNLVQDPTDETFVALWVNRNAGRKRPGDLLSGWKMFCDKVRSQQPNAKIRLVMHTNPYDIEGPNLPQIVRMLGVHDSVIFSQQNYNFSDMNVLYNAADVVLNVSCAEGFGLGTLEAMYAGKSIIVNATGGMKRQVRNHETGFVHGVEMEPDVRSLVGSQGIPYIYEDFVSHSKIADSIYKMWSAGHDARTEIGMKAREYALKEYSMKNLITSWDESLTEVIDKWRAGKRPRSWREVTL